MSDAPIILAVETSQIGSISLLRGNEQIDFWTGDDENSRSQDLLPEMSRLLEKNGVFKKDINLIAIATGPGSFTGLRVGVSIAMGLSQALGCARIGVPILSAMSLIEPESNVICVVPAGREQCYWQAFEKTNPITDIRLGNYADLTAESDKMHGSKIICEFSLFEKLQSMAQPVIAAPENLALLIGLCALANIAVATPKTEIIPLYVRDASVRT